MNLERKVDLGQCNDILSQIVGEYVWFVRCVEDDILRMEFGAPYLTIQGPRNIQRPVGEVPNHPFDRRVVVPTGKWSLFVEDGFWHAEANGISCSRRDTDRSSTDLCLNALSGQQVKKAFSPGGECGLDLEFDLSGKLRILNDVSADATCQWMLFFENTEVLSYTNEFDVVVEKIQVS